MTLPSGDPAARFRPPLRFHKSYALAMAILLAVEILIALVVRDRFVRPYLGDALAVALVYCALRATLDMRPVPAAALALAIAVTIEFGQYFQVLSLIGLEGSRVATTVLGSGFDPRDFLAYAAGAIGVLAIEAMRAQAKA